MENRPLSPQAYFGLQILYAIPIVGWIILIIHAIGAGNINMRNFARSYFCVLIIVLIIVGVTLALGGASAIAAFFQSFGHR